MKIHVIFLSRKIKDTENYNIEVKVCVEI